MLLSRKGNKRCSLAQNHKLSKVPYSVAPLNSHQLSGRELNNQEASSAAKDLKVKQRWDRSNHNSSLGRQLSEDHFLAGRKDKVSLANNSSDSHRQVSAQLELLAPLPSPQHQVQEDCLGLGRLRAVVVSSEDPSHKQPLEVADCLVEELVPQV